MICSDFDLLRLVLLLLLAVSPPTLLLLVVPSPPTPFSSRAMVGRSPEHCCDSNSKFEIRSSAARSCQQHSYHTGPGLWSGRMSYRVGNVFHCWWRDERCRLCRFIDIYMLFAIGGREKAATTFTMDSVVWMDGMDYRRCCCWCCSNQLNSTQVR